ncbi:MAG: stage III sporulation protein AF [Oscillospiraceae bacterium]|nr:stage III sporulation protein AF [Oscillospiraceae bacterium]
MEAVREYLIALVAVSMIAVLANALVHGEKMQKIVRFVGGLLILLVAMSPILKINLTDLARRMEDFGQAQGFDNSEVSQNSQEMLAALIKQNTETYIVQKAASIGATVRAEVTLSNEEYPTPVAVVIIGTLSAQQLADMEQYLSSALGIPKENQEWKLYE